jgi:diketogulonate reductase-like aldo/keto reductase
VGEDFERDCREGGCVVVAYCPLNAWPSKLAPVRDRHVATIAERIGRTPAQVLLRWALQRGTAVLTRSRSEARLKEAMAVFDFALSERDMQVRARCPCKLHCRCNLCVCPISDRMAAHRAPACP